MDPEFVQPRIADDGFAEQLAKHRRAELAAFVPGLGHALSGLWVGAATCLGLFAACLTWIVLRGMGDASGEATFLGVAGLAGLVICSRRHLQYQFASVTYAELLENIGRRSPWVTSPEPWCFRCRACGPPGEDLFCAACEAALVPSERADKLLRTMALAYRFGSASLIARSGSFPIVVHEPTGSAVLDRREFRSLQRLRLAAFPWWEARTIEAFSDPQSGPDMVWLSWSDSFDAPADSAALLTVAKVRLDGSKIAELWFDYAYVTIDGSWTVMRAAVEARDGAMPGPHSVGGAAAPQAQPRTSVAPSPRVPSRR